MNTCPTVDELIDVEEENTYTEDDLIDVEENPILCLGCGAMDKEEAKKWCFHGFKCKYPSCFDIYNNLHTTTD